MKKKIAILFEATGGGNYGAQNATIERIKHLKALNQYDIDVYMLEEYPCFLPRLIKHTPQKEKLHVIYIDGLEIQVLWYDFLLVDYLLEFKLGCLPIFRSRCFNKIAKKFQQYDLVSAHLLHCGEIALLAKRLFCVPFTVTWHGSDIHTNPWITKNIRNRTKSVIEAADMNCFVSQDLLDKSEKITSKGSKTVLYNGVDKTRFYPYASESKRLVQEKYGISPSCYNIAFVGHLVPIKNVLRLPEIFELVKEKIPNAYFHIAGDGKLGVKLKTLCALRQLPVRFHGRLDKNEMADFYNAIDLMVLPSLNEGLPLVIVEARACGTEVVASRVGGIAEVIGKSNTVILDENFVEVMTEKCIGKYEKAQSLPLNKLFDWKCTAKKEFEIYQGILEK